VGAPCTDLKFSAEQTAGKIQSQEPFFSQLNAVDILKVVQSTRLKSNGPRRENPHGLLRSILFAALSSLRGF
jgi:hypothetical protein